MNLLGGIEAGGTKFVCAVGTPDGEILAQVRFPTTTPDETLTEAVAFFKAYPTAITALGIGSFGPVDPDPASPTYGFITSTPKPHWTNTNVAGVIGRELGVPVGFDTDVNGAALGEMIWGAGRGLHTFLYLTIGTGIGGGAVINGRLLHGLVHPEMGHMRLQHDLERDPFAGACPYHGDCFEGLAAGPALEKRWGVRGERLPPDHPAWELEADYIAQAMANLAMIFSPQRIIIGGGVMNQQQLFPLVRQKTVTYLNGYVRSPAILEHIDTYLVPPGLGTQAGIKGCLALAQTALSDLPASPPQPRTRARRS